jgi:CBS domain-containing protein
MRVKDVLAAKGNPAVWTIRPDATIAELVERLAEHDIGALVVSDDRRRVLGIASERDVVRRLRDVPNPSLALVASIMTPDVLTCGPDDTLTAVMETMTVRHVRHVPVVADGVLVGMLSIGDAVKNRLQDLEFERDQLTNYVAGN